MLEFSEVETEDLKLIRRFLLWRYAFTTPTDPKHYQYGRQADDVGRELVKRTGDQRWKL